MKLTEKEEITKRKIYKILKESLQIVELNNNPIIDGKGFASERILKEVVQRERLSEETTLNKEIEEFCNYKLGRCIHKSKDCNDCDYKKNPCSYVE